MRNPAFSGTVHHLPLLALLLPVALLGQAAPPPAPLPTPTNLDFEQGQPGEVQAWIDAASFEVLGTVVTRREPARPLTGRGLENLTAFTRLFGDLRYFHPSDQAAAADWEALALAGVQAAEPAKSPEELARTLAGFFRPLAPTLRVYPTAGPRPPLPAELKPPPAGGVEVISWEHEGVKIAGKRPNVYRSERVTAAAAAPRPDAPLAVDLGGGVSALIPLALYKDGAGTLPHVPAPAAGKADAATPSGDDRDTRLADVVLAWNVFQHFYPYFDAVQADWPGELGKALTAAASDADERAFLKTLRRLVAALHDGHGNVYLSSQAATAELPVLFDWVEDQLAVSQVATAADAGGLKPGDVVVTLDGRPAREVLADTESLVSGATEQWRRWVALQRLVTGPKDEPVKIAARHPGGELFTADLKRTVPWSPESFPTPRPAKISEVKPGIFYVDIDRIGDDDFKGALDRLAGAKGIVFDLRGYPGNLSTIVLAHLTDEPVSSARWNVPIVTRPDRQGWRWATSSWSVRPEAPRFKAKVAFITDGRAISYAETYMGIVENYHLAAIVGGPTAGTNGNINPFTLPGGYNVVWTGMQVLKHDGSQHHGVGIQPTVPVSRTLKGVAEGRDELLERALAVVGQ